MARITGTAPDDPVTLIRMLSLHGQLLIFHVAQHTGLALLRWKKTEERVTVSAVSDGTRMPLVLRRRRRECIARFVGLDSCR